MDHAFFLGQRMTAEDERAANAYAAMPDQVRADMVEALHAVVTVMQARGYQCATDPADVRHLRLASAVARYIRDSDQ